MRLLRVLATCSALSALALVTACGGGSSGSPTGASMSGGSSSSSSSSSSTTSSGATVSTVSGAALVAGLTNGPEAGAKFNQPGGLAVDTSGNTYVADTGNSVIRKISAGGQVTTLAGPDGTLFYNPNGVAVDAAGMVYVANSYSHTILKITPAGAVTILAGTAGFPGSKDSPGALFSYPSGVTVDGAGNVYVADMGNDTIRKITAAGVVTTLAGSPGTPGSADGTGATASFDQPYGVAADTSGNVYVADTGNGLIRLVSSAGVVGTLALTGVTFNHPMGLAINTRTGELYVADTYDQTIRLIATNGTVTTVAGTLGVTGSGDGTSGTTFNFPGGIAVDSAGKLYVADTDNDTIRMIVP